LCGAFADGTRLAAGAAQGQGEAEMVVERKRARMGRRILSFESH
jgi:hypothetical protein